MKYNKDVFFMLAPTDARLLAVANNFSLPESCHFLGFSRFEVAGYRVAHNIDKRASNLSYRAINRFCHVVSQVLFGTSGDYASIIYNFQSLRSSRIIITGSDRMGFPVAVFNWLGLLKSKQIYVSIGLPIRLNNLIKDGGKYRFPVVSKILGSVSSMIAYSKYECSQINRLLAIDYFCQYQDFFVDSEFFYPIRRTDFKYDVITIGADINRDFDLFMEVVLGNPHVDFCMITSNEIIKKYPCLPENLVVFVDINLTTMIDIIRDSRLVFLPVLPNTYSAATTTLLQSMGLGKPVIISDVIPLSGYGFVSEKECIVIPPCDINSASNAINRVLQNYTNYINMGDLAAKVVCSKFELSLFIKDMCHRIDILIDS